MNPDNWTDRSPSATGNLSGRYLDEAVSSKCFVDMLALGMFPNAKEVTESFAIYNAVRQYCPWKMNDPFITLVSIGDGKSPRTASVFAFRSAWQTVSVDPRFGFNGPHPRVKRLTLVKSKIEDWYFQSPHQVVIVACHSHAPWQIALERVRGSEVMAVAMPCCYSHQLKIKPDYEYEDQACWSAKRRISIWMPSSLCKL